MSQNQLVSSASVEHAPSPDHHITMSPLSVRQRMGRLALASRSNLLRMSPLLGIASAKRVAVRETGYQLREYSSLLLPGNTGPGDHEGASTRRCGAQGLSRFHPAWFLLWL